ncbi:DNA translocase FtsK [Secundilactobacillus yichangensis]|uniref:DNA translocase FtsK n=1 Tax=Secundilactobacillus yichangensis TaxID=2799580 RepID=UPI00194163EB|nr:DNA translocase FtsK [Secundilactobacillus yichangensis]
MNHYDGPAFYRRYRRPEKSAEEPASPQFKVPGKQLKQTDDEPAIFRRDEPQRKALIAREERRKQVEERPETPPKQEKPIENNWQPAAPFRLTKVPKQLNRMVIRQPKINYTAMIKQYFQKSDSDVMLFDDGTQMPAESLVTEKPKLIFTPDSESDIEEPSTPTEEPQSEPEKPEQDSPAEPETDDKQSDNEQRIAAIQKRIDNLKAERAETEDKIVSAPETEAENTDSKVSIPQADEPQQAATPETDAAKEAPADSEQVPAQTMTPEPSTVESADEPKDEQPTVITKEPETPQAADEQAETEEQPVEPTAKPEPEHGLGHSLGDILEEENTSSQMNKLALFQDKPAAKPVSEVVQDDRGYKFPDTSLLTPPVKIDENALDEWIEHQGEVLDETLQAFHVDAHVVDWTVGPTVTQFQVHLSLGVKVNKITNLTDDLKLALAAKDIRIEAPIPGKTTVGIEIPNPKTRPVMLSEVLGSKAFKDSTSPLTVALGVDLFGQPRVTDLRKMPHGLIAGATGSGKSVFINSLLISLLYKATPAQLRLLLIDPKAVELAPYDGLPHLLSPVISDPQAAAAALKWAVKEMDDRYDRLAAAGVRNIEQYNDRAELTGDYAQKLPYIVIVIDELADLMMMASSEVQDYIVRITQKARAAGIHLLIATQRPSVDIVTGTIKNNIPTRVAFMVSSQVDSRTIIDTSGAERLLGKGDMLFLGNGASQPVRLQGTFVDKEVDRVTDFVRSQGKPHYAFDPDGLLEKQQVQESQDELMPEVLDYIVQEKTVSTSKLQRVFSIGYNRAANLIDTLENKQYISGQNGSKPRDVFLTEKQLAEMRAPRTD